MRLFTSILLVFLSTCLLSQNRIIGVVKDTIDNPLISSTVMLLDQDSSLIDFTQTRKDGSFKFSLVKKGLYQVKVTYVGYMAREIPVLVDKKETDLGTIALTEIRTELMEVVIKAAKAPMNIRGDTIEYDVAQFKVPDGSTIEDLLKRLPAMDVERDGTILSEGKVVSKVTVEGKDFFGNDPKTVTKNLPAEGVSKVQVFDKKTEEEKLTGAPSESDEKEMNIELKDEFKMGGFGKVIAAYGTENRAELKANYNRFNDKHQFSFIGVGNNTGRNGLNWNDYQDFMGSNSFIFNTNDMEYGFSSGGGIVSFSFGGESPLEGRIMSAFFSRENGGFPLSANGGVNYNFDNTKTKAGARYFYNYSGNTKVTDSYSTSFYNNFSAQNTGNSKDNKGFHGHRAEANFSTEIDSFHHVRIMTNTARVNSENTSIKANLSLREDETKITESDIDNSNFFSGFMTNATASLRKSFRKNGRYLGANFTYLYTDVDEAYNSFSDLRFYGNDNELDNTQLINRDQNSKAYKHGLNANLMFAEPLSKLFFLSTFYNFRNTRQNGDVDVFDNVMQSRDDYLSRIYNHGILYQRIGSSIRFTNKGVNVTLGAAYKSLKLDGDYHSKGAQLLKGTVDQSFTGWLPYLAARYNLRRTFRIGITFSQNIKEPGIKELLPIVDNKNPLYITEGNPELQPERINDLSFDVSYGIPVSGFRIYARGGYNEKSKSIIYEQKVDNNLITHSKPVNYEGGGRMNIYSGINIPIYGRKIRSGINFSASESNSFAIVNDVINETTTIALNPSIRFNILPNNNFETILRYSFRRSITEYNINTSQNQQIDQNHFAIELNFKLGKGWELEGGYDHNIYHNDYFGQSTTIPLINFSISKKLLKANKGTLRLSVYDLLDKNINYSQYASGNIVMENSTESLSQYFLLSFAYDLKSSSGGKGGNSITIKK